jgi:AcrR family transcriptional regulator
MADEKRTYRKKRRAELEEQTRLRITESAVALHGSVGPARTSISAVAEHAGVRRSTVYRHFPDEAALFTACTAHWSAQNPPPDLAEWARIENPDERLRSALTELYDYYRRTEPMMKNVHRDESTMELVQRMFAPFRSYLSGAGQTLMSGRGLRGRARRSVAAAVGHALEFPTWQSLTRGHGLEDAGAVELMCRLVDAAAGTGRARD